MTSKPALLLAIGFLAAVQASPGAAASATTDAFVAKTAANTGFLVASSRIASVETASRRNRSFARDQIRSQAMVGDALIAWRQAEQRTDEKADAAPTIDHLGPVFGLARLPIDGPTIGGEALIAAERQDLARLTGLRRQEFDTFYIAAQERALLDLIAAYKSYILNGDDDTLRALAVHSLPRTEGILARLRLL